MLDYFQDRWHKTNPHKTGKHIETATTETSMPHRDGHGGRRASPRNHGVPQIEGLFYIQRTSRFTVSFVSLQSKGAGVWSDLSRPLDYVNHCHHHHHHYKKTLPKVEEIAECTHCSTAMNKLNQSQSRVVRSSFRLQGRNMANLVPGTMAT